MAKKKKKCEDVRKEICDNLSYEYRRWEEVFLYGAQDPFYEDGCNLWLIRNHISYYKKMAEDELNPEDYPEEYYWILPPEVPQKYMANADEIRREAKDTLEAVKKDANYEYLISVRSKPTADKELQRLLYPLLYIPVLENAIAKDELVEMRRYKNKDKMLDMMREKAEKVRDMLGTSKPLPEGQLSIFDLFSIA